MANLPTDPLPSVSGLRSLGTGSQQAAAGNDARLSPLNTKGDIHGYSTVNARVPVGTIDYQVLGADSTNANGVSYSNRVRTLSAQVGGATVTNPGAATETNLDLNVTLPANFFVVGKAIRTTVELTASGGAVNTTKFKLKAGTVTLSDVGPQTATATTTSQWLFEWVSVCTVVGASGTVVTSCTNNEKLSNGVFQINQVTATVDTTGTNVIQISVTFSTALATDAATLKLFLVESLN